MGVRAKICGINTVDAAEAAAANGADFVGFVFYPPSPRDVAPNQAADIAQTLGGRVSTVGLFVDADDATIAGTLAQVPLDMLQLHGAESPDRVRAVRTRHQRPVMKAIAQIPRRGYSTSTASRKAFDCWASTVSRICLMAL